MKNTQRALLPPGPKTKNPLGQLIAFRKDSIAFLTSIAREYGDIAMFKIGPFPVVLLNHPDYIKEVLTVQHHNFIKGRPLEMTKVLFGEGLLTSEGELHKRQSRIIQPAFHRRMIESYAQAMTECTREMMDTWKDGMRLDMRNEMIKVSMAIAGKTLFSVDIRREAPEIMKALEDISGLFNRITIPGAELSLKLPLPGTFRFYRAKAQLDAAINRIIGNRRQNDTGNGDLLSLLLEAQKGQGGEEGISDQQVRDEAITLFLTAFDTTSNALTWAWYLLSLHPEAEAEMHEEIGRVLQGRTPTAQDTDRLAFTRMVFGESMRVFPPSWVIARQALGEFSIHTYTIPKGAIVLMSPYLIHHDSRFRAEPERFDPRAWGAHEQKQDSKYEFFPFGGGPRACIGQHYAWMEGVLLLALIGQHWRLKLAPNHPVVPEQLLNLRPKYGMMMELEQRKPM